ncbi:MAG: protein-L-isoaspartate(D-aspartate) O-methyltransferase [Nitrospirota bacterium]
MNYRKASNKMVEEQLIKRNIKDEKVLTAMRKVPRHLFLEEVLWNRAYDDHALPIGDRQTISQPYMAALMTETLELTENDRVLEIGTGSGYQTAILAEICKKVYSIERIKGLAMKARKILEELNYHNAVIKIFDGTYGWIDESPFDAIIVTAGAPDIPSLLIDQLNEDGRMIIPIGDRYSQVLKKIIKKEGETTIISMTNCVFVPLIGSYGWKDIEEKE